MITNLNSWSFEPSSNKSVVPRRSFMAKADDPSIPIPSDDQSGAGHRSAYVPFRSAASVNPRVDGPVSSHSRPLVSIRGSFAHRLAVNFTFFTFFTFPNSLIARVCTALHVNQIIFPPRNELSLPS